MFFNAGTCQNPSNVTCNTPGAVPVHGPNGRIGSATIQANGSAYDPLGLTNDYELDYGIGSSSGATTGVVYANATLGIDYCTNTNVSTAPGSFGQCQAYTSPSLSVRLWGGDRRDEQRHERVPDARDHQFGTQPALPAHPSGRTRSAHRHWALAPGGALERLRLQPLPVR